MIHSALLIQHLRFQIVCKIAFFSREKIGNPPTPLERHSVWHTTHNLVCHLSGRREIAQVCSPHLLFPVYLFNSRTVSPDSSNCGTSYERKKRRFRNRPQRNLWEVIFPHQKLTSSRVYSYPVQVVLKIHVRKKRGPAIENYILSGECLARITYADYIIVHYYLRFIATLSQHHR